MMKASNYLLNALTAFCFSLFSLVGITQCSDVLVVIATAETGPELSWNITNDSGEVLAAGNGYQPNSATTEIVCLDSACYTFNMFSIDGWNGSLATLILDDQVLGLGFGNGPEDSFMFSVNMDDCSDPLPFGCTDQTACNFDPNAVIDDQSCTYPGCMDPAALNWDPFAGCDGPCEYENDCPVDQWLIVELYDSFGDGWNGASYELVALDGTLIHSGTMFQGEYQVDTLCVEDGCYSFIVGGGSFDSEIEWVLSNNSGLFQGGSAPSVNNVAFNSDDCPQEIYGCQVPEACNYDSLATIEDGSCTYPGCMDITALNYNPNAGCEGECIYPEPCEGATVTLTLVSFGETYVGIQDAQGNIVAEVETSFDWPTNATQACLEDGCYNAIFEMGPIGSDSTLYAQLGVDIDLESDGIIDESYVHWIDSSELFLELEFGINDDSCGPTFGCTDPNACNYNSLATMDDWSCTYPGCTDTTAWNYEQWAGCDDGSCEYLECDNPIFLSWYVSVLDPTLPVSWSLTDENGNVVASDALDLSEWNWVEPACVDDGCYTFTLSGEVGLVTSTWVSFSVDLDGDMQYDLYYSGEIGESGSVSFEFGVNSSCQDPCDENEIVVEMYDSFGDGWNGAEYLIVGSDSTSAAGSLITGSYGADYHCLPNGCYIIQIPFGGSFPDEIEWVVSMGDEILASGGAFDMALFGLGTDCDGGIGCTDPNACEYDPNADIDDGSCTYPGCTDPEALNYSPYAGCDDNSCEYPEPCDGVNALLYVCTFGNGENVEMDILDSSGNLVMEVSNLPSVTISYFDLCLDPQECYTAVMYNTEETGWYGGYFWINVDGVTIITDELDYDLAEEAVNFSLEGTCPVLGCTDPTAINYNPNATIDDGTCEYGPDNDLCANATPIEPGTYAISNVGAFLNEGFDGDCWGFGAGEDEQTSIWFSFTTPDEPANIVLESWGDGSYTLTDTQFGLYQTCNDSAATACDGNSGDGLFAMFNFQCGELEPATTYLLQIDGWNSDAGTCMLTFEINDCDAYIPGCTDPYACNYDSTATTDDWSCTYPGCTDTAAWNYQDWAGCDNGSCQYVDCADPILAAWYVSTLDYNQPIWLQILNDAGEIVFEHELDYLDYNWITPLCLEDGCYTALFITAADGLNADSYVNFSLDLDGDFIYDLWFDGVMSNGEVAFEFGINSDCSGAPCDATQVAMTMYDTFGDGWNEAYYEIWSTTTDMIYTGTLDSASYAVDYLCLEDGCYEIVVGGGLFDSEIEWTLTVGDELIAAGNAPYVGQFGINADCGDVIYGCMDQTACNFDPLATQWDDSCTYPGCLDPNALNYNPNAGCDADCIYPQECEYNEVIMSMFDSFGDGWNDAYYVIYSDSTDMVYTGYLDYGEYAVDTLCLPDGCYEIFVEGGTFNSEIEWTLTSGDLFLAGGTAPYEGVFGLNSDCEELLAGCMDQTACNFDPNAQIEDDSCTYPGCMDPNALNYNPNAGCDGECIYPEECEHNEVIMSMYDSFGDGWNDAYYLIYSDSTDIVYTGYLEYGEYAVDTLCLPDGCYQIFVEGGTFNSEIEWTLTSGDLFLAGGSAPYEGVFGLNSDCEELLVGCMDQTACNFDPNAQIEDDSCTYPGCMDPEASNYDPNAGCDGDCIYPEPCDATAVTIWISTQSFGEEVSWELIDDSGNVVADGGEYGSYGNFYQEVCLEDGCYILDMHDSFGDGWNGAFYMLFSDDGLIAEGTLPWGSYQLDVVSLNSDCDIDGCTDPTAFNFSPGATLDDGSCLYSGGNFGYQSGLQMGPVELEVTMSPNVVSNASKLVVAGLNKNLGFEVMVVDMMGRLVYQENFGNELETRQINMILDDLTSGMYFSVVRQGSNMATVQFVVAN